MGGGLRRRAGDDHKKVAEASRASRHGEDASAGSGTGGKQPCQQDPRRPRALTPCHRAIGAAFTCVWLAVAAVYVFWDGWLDEWRVCGYDGPNQHWDTDLWDMRWHLEPGPDGTQRVVLESLGNLHNLLFLCAYPFLFGALGLLLDSPWLRQWCLALFPIVVGAFGTTLFDVHRYIITMCYDTVHVSGIVLAGIILASGEKVSPRAGFPALLFAWALYLVSRVLCCKWPFWEHPLAFFSVNQINEGLFEGYGLEFAPVVLLLHGLHHATAGVNAWQERVFGVTHGWWRAAAPIALYLGVTLVLNVLGLVPVAVVDTGTCPGPSSAVAGS